jgi:hypothetical protein
MSSIVEHIQDLIDEHGSWENYLKSLDDEPQQHHYGQDAQKENDAFEPDSIVQTISNRFIDRAKMGWNKYGTNLDRKDLSVSEWVQHLQDELHDAYLYSEKLKQDEIKRDRLLNLALKQTEGDKDLSYLTHSEVKEFLNLMKWYNEQEKEETPNPPKRTVPANY